MDQPMPLDSIKNEIFIKTNVDFLQKISLKARLVDKGYTMGVFPQNPKDHFLQHVSGSAVGTKATRWKCWWVALTWTIWKHRNGVIFAKLSKEVK